jgi:hypothetical protein
VVLSFWEIAQDASGWQSGRKDSISTPQTDSKVSGDHSSE